LVLATLHTNDAASAVTRLADMGIEPYLLASSLLGVLAQRLVRSLCMSCRARGDEPGRYRAVGCERCRHTGYQGRRGIYELLLVDAALQEMIHARRPDAELLLCARSAGMLTLREDAQRWLESGVTTLEEVMRVTGH